MEKMRKFLFLCALLLGVVQVAVADDDTATTGTDITPSGYNWENTGTLPTISSVLTPRTNNNTTANETADGYNYSSEYKDGLVGLFSGVGNSYLKNGISVVDFGGKVGRVLAFIGNGETSLETDFKNATDRSIDLTGVGSNPGFVKLNFFFPNSTPTSSSNAQAEPTDNYVKVKIIYNNYKVKLNSISLINDNGNAVGQSIIETDTINSLTRWKSAELVSWCPKNSTPLRLVVNISNNLNNSDGGFFIKEISFTSYTGTPSTFSGTVTPTKHELSLDNTIEFASTDYATYYDENAYVMPTGVQGGPVTVSGETATVTYQYTADSTVPAKTPLLLKRTDANLASATISYSGTRTATECGTNNLKGGGDTGACYLNGDIIPTSGHIYYMLSFDSNGENLGFYYGKDNGAAFNIYRHRCFLDVESTSSAKGFVIEEKTTTGIESIENATPDAAVYTLSGIRMSGKQLPAGIYVRGGKKFVVK